MHVAVAATFTANPLEQPLACWFDVLGTPATITTAAPGPLAAALLDPSSPIGPQSSAALSVLLLRASDLTAVPEPSAATPASEESSQIYPDLALLREILAQRARGGHRHVVVICPSRVDAASGDDAAAIRDQFGRLEAACRDALDDLPYVQTVTSDVLTVRTGEALHDRVADRVGQIPYGPLFFAELARQIARVWSSGQVPARKVLVLDADHTLWQGIVGEDGVAGVTFGPGARLVQEYARKLQSRGVLLALCSKNVESDVRSVFTERPDCGLRLDDFAAMRVNWDAKSRNLAAIAADLGLGLDSLVLMDDSALECAEVRTALPSVIALQVPADPAALEMLLDQVWAFDGAAATAEAKTRTVLYREDAERRAFQQRVTSHDAFIEGLGLRIDIQDAQPADHARVAELSLRTNQFNVTRERWSEDGLGAAIAGGMRVSVVRVADRFGDYGLVGVVAWSADMTSRTATVRGFLLSCRALGRGVERAMLASLGTQTVALGLREVRLPFVPSDRSEPARRFLASLVDATVEVDHGVQVFALTAEASAAARVNAIPAAADDVALSVDSPAVPTAGVTPAAPAIEDGGDAVLLARAYERIALELATPAASLTMIRGVRRARPAVATSFLAPQSDLQRTIANVWRDVLYIEELGIHDNFFDLGGRSLDLVRVVSELASRDVTVTLMDLFQYTTVATLAHRLSGRDQTDRTPGGAGQGDRTAQRIAQRNRALAAAARRAPRAS
jgi:FkbH-like protein